MLNMTTTTTITPQQLKTKTVCFVDNGLFVDFCRTVGKDFKKAYYYKPDWRCAFPQSRQVVVGQGFDEIEPILFPLDKFDSIDLWVFLDLYQSDFQLFLESHGARVWGQRKGDEMELHRWEFREHLKTIGLPVAGCERIRGMTALRKYLKDTKNKFVKTSFTRGDFETFRHDNFFTSEPRLDELAHSLGAVKEHYEFLVEDEIPDCIEVGYDGYVVDGKFPNHAMMAYEVKDVGMIGMVKEYSELAKPVRDVNSALADTFLSYNYRGFFASEIRYGKERKPYLIDPCCRLGTPSNELLQELFDGWGTVLWHGAEGVLVNPRVKKKFGVLACIVSEFAVENWHTLQVPKEIDEHVKLRFHTRIDDKEVIAPQTVGLPDVGYVAAAGSTLLEAIALCKERAEMIKGFQVKVSLEGIDKALECVKEGEKFGVKFSDSLPTSEQVRKS